MAALVASPAKAQTQSGFKTIYTDTTTATTAFDSTYIGFTGFVWLTVFNNGTSTLAVAFNNDTTYAKHRVDYIYPGYSYTYPPLIGCQGYWIRTKGIGGSCPRQIQAKY
jgi:hypothetical protein